MTLGGSFHLKLNLGSKNLLTSVTGGTFGNHLQDGDILEINLIIVETITVVAQNLISMVVMHPPKKSSQSQKISEDIYQPGLNHSFQA